MHSNTRPPRITLDTNVFVSAILLPGSGARQFLEAAIGQQTRLIVTEGIMHELRSVLSRPRLVTRYGLDAALIADVLHRVEAAAEAVNPATVLSVEIRDPKDEMILASALGGRAALIVTGDKDLLVLAGDSRLGSIRIKTIREALDLLSIGSLPTSPDRS